MVVTLSPAQNLALQGTKKYRKKILQKNEFWYIVQKLKSSHLSNTKTKWCYSKVTAVMVWLLVFSWCIYWYNFKLSSFQILNLKIANFRMHHLTLPMSSIFNPSWVQNSFTRLLISSERFIVTGSFLRKKETKMGNK